MALNHEAVQLLNTAIIKSKEKKIDSCYEERLAAICSSPAIEALGVAATHLAQSQNISTDHAAIVLIETLRDLDKIWSDYVMTEGISKLKDLLANNTSH